jgi:drug/metabolite transporter (DMT)-like permease
VLLVYALRVSDLSILGPVNAYKSVLSLLLGAVMIGEVPTAVGLGGVLLILAGSLFVTGGTGGVRFFGDRGVQLRIAALGCSATEAVYLKKALLVASPEAAFVFWSLLGVPIASAALWQLQRTPDRRAILADWKTSRCSRSPRA